MKCRLCNLEMSKHDYYSEHKKTCEDRFGVGSTTVRSGSSSSSSSSSTDYASRRENSVSFELGNKKQANQAAAAALIFLPPSAMPARRAVSQPASQPPTGGVHAKLNHHYSTLLRITLSQTGLAIHMGTCGKRRRRLEMLNGASSITGASGSTASSSSESAPPPLPLLGPLTRALCSLPADRQHENLPAFQMELESGADEIKAEVEAHENTLLLSADILQPDRQPGGVDGKADPYIPQWSRVSTKFLDLQAESRRRGGIAGVGIIEGPVTRLMRLPRSILHTAVAKSALRLSKKRMNKVASFAKTLCADQFRGAALKVPSVDTVKRHVSRACDRAVDEGVLRQATYHGEADWRRIASLRPAMLAG